jgi:hypothetical protein
MEYIREEVVAGLKSAVAMVTFEKADGTERTMRCTLVETFLPKVKKGSKKTREVNEDTIAAFDLDKGEWRSFRLDSVKDITYFNADSVAA